MNLYRMDPTQVVSHACSGALAVIPEADAECEALEGLFQMSLEAETELSDAMGGTIVRMQSANNELMRRFQDVSALSASLYERVIESTSRLKQLTRVNQAQQEAFDNQLQHMQRQIARLEQEKVEILRQRDEEVALAARRQEEAMRAAGEATRAQIEALNLVHAATVALIETTHTNATAALTQAHTIAIQTLTNTHTTAFAVIQDQLTQSIHNTQEALQNVAHKEEENKLLVEENKTVKRILTYPGIRRYLGM